VDPDSIEKIRTATFPLGRRGYERREVDRFLAKLADWLETGGADSARSDTVRRELERIGEQTGQILTNAHDAGDQIRGVAEEEAAETQTAADRYASSTRAEADAYAERTRIEADAYSEETRGEADAYAARTRREADEYGAQARGEADEYADSARAEGEARAGQVTEGAERRRQEIETVIADLEERRDGVLGEMQRLSSELTGSATQHRPGSEPEPEPEAEGEPETAKQQAK
jgi:DivIVA domain-containing protein